MIKKLKKCVMNKILIIIKIYLMILGIECIHDLMGGNFSFREINFLVPLLYSIILLLLYLYTTKVHLLLIRKIHSKRQFWDFVIKMVVCYFFILCIYLLGTFLENNTLTIYHNLVRPLIFTLILFPIVTFLHKYW
jgi:hypothetical protein